MPSEATKKAADSLRQRSRNINAKNERKLDFNATVAAAKDKKLQELDKKPTKKICVRFAKVLAQVVVLVLVNVGFLLVGAFIFHQLESYNEIENCIKARDEYLTLMDTTIDLMKQDVEVLHGDKVNDQAVLEMGDKYQVYVRDFALNMVRIGYKYNASRNCADLGGDADWTFSSSLIFALTVVTTIGYGVIAPATNAGRLICIAYAVIGIPIYMVALASIGDVLARQFKKGYWLICCCGCFKKKQKPLTLLSSANKDTEGDKNKPSVSKFSVANQEEDDEDNESTKELDISRITIPLSLTIILLLICVLIGAAIFVALEEDWTFVNAFYFSFITISTIGFGDEVPAFDLTVKGHTGKLVTMIFYITVGMSALSMCFQLMADEMVAKFIWISNKCGSKKSDDDDGDDKSSDTPQPSGFQLSRSSTFARSNTKLNLRSSLTRVKTRPQQPSTTRRSKLPVK